MRKLLVLPFLLFVAGCAPGSTVGSLLKGECQLTHTSPVAVYGVTQYDQDWIDETTESLVRGCNQPRPEARPVNIQSPIARHPVPHRSFVKRILHRQPKPVEVEPVPEPTVAPTVNRHVPSLEPEKPAPPPKKKHWWQRKPKASPQPNT